MRNEENNSIETWLRPLIKAVVKECMAEFKQPEAPRLYSPQEAAERLNVPLRWIREGTSRKTIPFRKVGKYTRFSDADLKEIQDKASVRQSGV